MRIETGNLSSRFVAEYEAVPIAFEVKSVLVVPQPATAGFVPLAEVPNNPPYTKNYDAISDRPGTWATRFDTSTWALCLARLEGQCVGGATVAFATPGLDLLEGRNDLALLWDIRVAPAFRGRGVGRALFEAAEALALVRGCRQLKVETQDVNVAACRFYAAMGCELQVVRDNAYPECPGESQFLWYKALAA